jgi:hypothetical protein
MAGADARPSSIRRLPAAKWSRAWPPANTKNISFIQEIADCAVEDITADILAEAALPEIALTKIPTTGADLQTDRFDHERDLRKHERG